MAAKIGKNGQSVPDSYEQLMRQKLILKLAFSFKSGDHIYYMMILKYGRI